MDLPQLSLQLLGSFELTVGGDSSLWIPAGPRHLLALLGLSGGRSSWNRALEAVGGSGRGPGSESELRSMVAALDDTAPLSVRLEEDQLVVANALDVDVDRARGTARRALAAERSADLDGLSLELLYRDILEDWRHDRVVSHRNAFHDTRMAALSSSVDVLTRADRVAEAIGVCSQVLAAKPLLEWAHLRLAELHHRAGSPEEALDALDRYARRLALDTGLEPSRSFVDLQRTITHRGGPIRPTGPATVDDGPQRWCEPAVGDRHPAPDRRPAGERPDGAGPVRLDVTSFGRFELRIDGVLVDDLPGTIGPSIFRFLLHRTSRTATREELLDTFWPDVAPSVAGNRLRVALSGVRRSLRRVVDHPILAHRAGRYSIDSRVVVHTDVERFESRLEQARRSVAAGRIDDAVAAYRQAAWLYVGDFGADLP